MNVPEDQDPLLNTVLGGARIQRRVSAGLLANVYLGNYERLNLPVAVKVLSPKATSQGMNKERFVREGRALAQLSHPNIIKIYNVGHENGRYFIVMDWIQDGMNLRQLAQSRPLTPSQSLKVVRRLSEALDYIHQKNLIHRDLKPANICLRKGGHPVLMDFSLIKDQSSDVQLTAPGTIMGTVNFMPPEQAQPGGPFGNVGPWSDVYSLAGTLYWLLTGRPPFKGRTPMETIIKLIRESVPAPSTVNPTIPPEVDAFVAKCLMKKSDERFQSAREFAAAIDDLMVRCADALQRGAPPPLAEDDGAPGAPGAGPASAAGAPPPSGTSGPNRNWGAVAAGARPPSSGAQPAIPPGMPAPSPLSQAPAAVPPTPVTAGAGTGPRSTARLNASGQNPVAADPTARPSARLGVGSGPVQAASPMGPPPVVGGQPQPWSQATPEQIADLEAQTVRIQQQGQAAQARSSGDRVLPRPGVGFTSAPVAAAAPAPPPFNPAAIPPAPGSKAETDSLRRSWVEDAPAAPSWTDQDAGASTRGSVPAPAGLAMPEASGSASGSAEVERKIPARGSSSDERLMKAPTLPKKSRRGLETALVAAAIVIIIGCVAVAIWFMVGRSP